MPSLVLHTTGAKTGEPRDTALMYCPDGDDMLVTGSNFARENHPAWTANLLKHPDAAVSVRGRRIAVRATLVPDAEREATWRQARRRTGPDTAATSARRGVSCASSGWSREARAPVRRRPACSPVIDASASAAPTRARCDSACGVLPI